MNTGENIKTFRKYYNLTQTELGKIAGVSNRAVSDWELNKKFPRRAALDKISKHYDVPTHYITEGIPNETERELLQNFRKLNPQGKKGLMDFIKSILEGNEK